MANDLWRTPPSVIAYVENRWGNIAVDLCASDDNKVGWMPEFFSEENSMLLATEDDIFNAVSDGGDRNCSLLWCNPPYSNPWPFVDKCKQIAEWGHEVVMLLNIDTSTEWFMIADVFATGIHPVTGGRIAFHDENDIQMNGNDKAQVIIKFGGYGLQQWETIHISKLQVKTPKPKPMPIAEARQITGFVKQPFQDGQVCGCEHKVKKSNPLNEGVVGSFLKQGDASLSICNKCLIKRATEQKEKAID